MDCSCGHANSPEFAYCEICGSKLFGAVENPVAMRCIHCSEEFTLDQALWCMCETDNPTYLCPHCQKCACPK